jgi:hypothetical protein
MPTTTDVARNSNNANTIRRLLIGGWEWAKPLVDLIVWLVALLLFCAAVTGTAIGIIYGAKWLVLYLFSLL